MRLFSPSSKLGLIVDKGAVRVVMMYVAACCKKSQYLTRNGIFLGVNVAVSISLTNLDKVYTIKASLLCRLIRQ